MAVIGVIVSCVRLSYSQSGSGSGMVPNGDMNMSNVSCPTDMLCKELPPRCLDCNYSTDCTYGENTNVTCTPLEGVECNVRSVCN